MVKNLFTEGNGIKTSAAKLIALGKDKIDKKSAKDEIKTMEDWNKKATNAPRWDDITLDL